MTHPKLVESMLRPDFYPHRPETVELVQTHISFVFIAGDEVYKIKKPVNFGFLDFTTPEKRKFYCGEEVRLNRRLAGDTYLGVAEIREEKAGGLSLSGDGPVVEYAVRMRRLPQERMLKGLLLEGAVDISVMDNVARKIAAFHAGAETGGRIDEVGGIETIRRNHDENFEQTAKYRGITIPAHQWTFIRDYIAFFMDRNGELLHRRVAEHRIRDCHGDLHLEHICLAGEIVIFDCIEFNERFRFEDTAAEAAFLAMDLDYNGYPEWAEAFVTAYIRHSGDEAVRMLLNFYKCYYAFVRGKVVSFRLDDPAIGEEGRREAREMAEKYFDWAYTYAARPERPALILTAGLMGTGKSVVARQIAPRLGARIIQMDALRKELAGLAPGEKRSEDFGEGLYSEEVSRKTYAAALDRAATAIRSGRSAVIDGSYKRREERLRALEAARSLDADFIVLECRCDEGKVRRRLESRQSEAGEPSDGRWEIFRQQQADYDAVHELPKECHGVVETDVLPEEAADRALRRLRFPA
ncbi:MAG: AAA family ATPase [Syntrophaceae bacterium]|nr:AAA family ATPase [Syntrophaceae bacterium]